MDTDGRWYTELVTPDLRVQYLVRREVYSARTRFQKVEVLDTAPYGRVLLLDGKTQSTQVDEHIYHESLVHPAMLMHPRPRRVLIGGGGEGATLREVLRYPVESATMVDIDEEVVEVCRRYLPHLHQESFSDPRATLIIADAREFLANSEQSYDVIVFDLADPIEAGPAYRLYTREFYEIARSRLAPGGIFVTQSGPAGPLTMHECYLAIVNTLRAVFPHTATYTVWVPSFIVPWGFTVASASPLPDLTPEEVDARIAQRVRGILRFYDGETHRQMFSLPRYLRDGLSQVKRVATDADPVFVV